MSPVGLCSPPALCTLSLVLALFNPASGASEAAGSEAAGALVFEEQLDGKCQILSEGGKLVVLRNTHAGRTVRYRLIRLFANVPQSRIDGEIEPGGAPQKLGCNRVGGRQQSWKIERAALVEQTP
jgi:hypothetical protein